MKRLFALVIVCALGGGFVLAQESNPQAMLKEFTRSVKLEGYTISFVLLNEKTVDALFQAPGKYAIRARASQATTFYVQGVPEKDMPIDTKFSAEQDGETIAGSAMNIKNFDGNTVTKGTRFDGLVQLDKKLDLKHPFKIKGTHGSVEFKLSEEALKLMSSNPTP